MLCFRVARSDKKQRRGAEEKAGKTEWHGGLEPPHFSEEEAARSSALQLCDAVAFRLRRTGPGAAALVTEETV